MEPGMERCSGLILVLLCVRSRWLDGATLAWPLYFAVIVLTEWQSSLNLLAAFRVYVLPNVAKNFCRYSDYKDTYFSLSPKHLKTRSPWALSLCLCCWTTSPDIQISWVMDMLLKWSILLFKVQVYLYSSVSLHDPNPKIKVTSIKLGLIDIQVDLQNCHIWAWNLAISKTSRNCTFSLFLFHVVQIKLNFHSTGSSFRDTGQFSKLLYLGIKLGNQAKFQKLHTYPLSTLEGQNWAYFRSTGSGFPRGSHN